MSSRLSATSIAYFSTYRSTAWASLYNRSNILADTGWGEVSSLYNVLRTSFFEVVAFVIIYISSEIVLLLATTNSFFANAFNQSSSANSCTVCYHCLSIKCTSSSVYCNLCSTRCCLENVRLWWLLYIYFCQIVTLGQLCEIVLDNSSSDKGNGDTESQNFEHLVSCSFHELSNLNYKHQRASYI